MNPNLITSFKSEGKSGGTFDDAIKRMADEIVKMVNVPKKEDFKKKK